MARAHDLIDGETETGGSPRLHPGLLGEPQAKDGRLPQWQKEDATCGTAINAVLWLPHAPTHMCI